MESTGTKGRVRDKEMQKEKEVHGKKGQRGVRKYARGGPLAGMLNKILGGELRDKTIGKYGELKEVLEEKEVRECGTRHKQKNNRWRGKQEVEQKLKRDENLLATHKPQVVFQRSGVHPPRHAEPAPLRGKIYTKDRQQYNLNTILNSPKK